MATLGPTTERTYGAEWNGSGADNQHCSPETMPSGGGRVTDINVWIRGKDASCSFKGVVWNSTRNTVLGQTATQTATGASFALGNSLNYGDPVVTPFDVGSSEVINIGYCRNPTGAMQHSYNNTGVHYDDISGSSNPSGMSGEVSHSFETAFYITYETISETYVRRGGSWIKNTETYARRTGAWSAAGPDVYVRRTGAWVKA